MPRLLISSLLCLGLAAAQPAVAQTPLPDLGARIEAFQGERPAPSARQREVMGQAARELAAAMPDPGLQVGERAPDFRLPDAHGRPVQLSALLAEGPVVLVFYRGAWCPYCNLQLKALKESLPALEGHGAQLVAVTPQTPQRSAGQVAADGYPFPILSDLDDRVMRAYRLYFEVPAELRALYQQDFGLDLADYNGEGRYGLPVPGSFVIDRDGVVRAAFADTDYTRRAEPSAIVEALAEIDHER